jgi:hypothetical protein
MNTVTWPDTLPTARDLTREAGEWRVHASALAPFVDAHLVNRRDVWGGYFPLERREPGQPYTYTAPGKEWRGRAILDAWRIARHLSGESEGHVIGLHSSSADDWSRWGGFDFDAHDNPPADYLEALALAALSIVERLAEYGAAPLLEDSNGAGGWHVWVYFDAPARTADVFAWLDALAERARLDFGVAVETYPKQASVRGAFGNWLRLPGRHHKRAHWSRVARPGEAWRSGAAAVHTLLAWPATPAAVVPPADAWPLRSAGIVDATPHSYALPSERAPLIRAYLHKLEHGHAGSGRSNRLFSLARFLRHGMQCDESTALGIMHAWNVGNAPPLDDAKVLATWRNTAVYNARPYFLRHGGSHAA